MNEVDVVTRALRHEAETWDEQSATIGRAADAADALRLTGLQAGIFVLMRDAYEGAVDQVAARAREGVPAMADIAGALRANAGAYERGDEDVAQHVTGAY